jgi:epoxyqueuosine reductase
MILLFMKDAILKEVLRRGFDLAGVAAAEPLADDFGRFEEWLRRGCAAGMDYLALRRDLRRDPGTLLAGARSVIVAAAAYAPITPPGPLAAYAVCPDYHTRFRVRLEEAAARIRALHPGARCRIAVDTAPLLERALAARAGIGWIGRSTSLVTERFGPYVLLGEILTDLALEPDPPHPSRCEDCGECLRACPTGALTAAYTLDARRCLSYLTIEKRGAFTAAEQEMMASGRGETGRAFGCDLCLAACPRAKEAAARPHPPDEGRFLAPLPHLASADLDRIAALCEGGFKRAFGKTPVLRAGRKGLLRNLAASRGPSPASGD